MGQDARKYKNPQPVVPGRVVDWQTGGQNPDMKRVFDLLRELERKKAEVGAISSDVSITADDDDVLIFDGSTGEWVNIDKTELLALDDLTNATETSTADGNFLVFYDSAWRNQNFTTGSLGINADNDADTMLAHVFAVRDDPNTTWFNGVTSNVRSGLRGWHISKEKDQATPHGWTFHSDGAPCWEIGMDSSTNNAFNSGFGNSDLAFFDHSVGAFTGGDVVRISPAEASTVGPLATKFSFGERGGSPVANTEAFLFAGGNTTTSLGGVRVNYWSSLATRFALTLINAHGTNKHCIVNFQDQWYLGNDLLGAGNQGFWLWDQVAGATRLLVSADGRFQIGGQVLAGSVCSVSRAAGSNPTLKTLFTVTTPADTALTASTEFSSVVLDCSATRQWSTGALTNQRAVRVLAPTIGFVGASTLTNAATLYVDREPQAGTNATITNSYALWVDAGVSRFDGNVSLTDGANVLVGATTGTKFATATTDKMGWWNATPVVQDTGWSVTNGSTDRALDVSGDTLAQVAAVLGTLIDTLKSYGILGA